MFKMDMDCTCNYALELHEHTALAAQFKVVMTKHDRERIHTEIST